MVSSSSLDDNQTRTNYGLFDHTLQPHFYLSAPTLSINVWDTCILLHHDVSATQTVSQMESALRVYLQSRIAIPSSHLYLELTNRSFEFIQTWLVHFKHQHQAEIGTSYCSLTNTHDTQLFTSSKKSQMSLSDSNNT